MGTTSWHGRGINFWSACKAREDPRSRQKLSHGHLVLTSYSCFRSCVNYEQGKQQRKIQFLYLKLPVDSNWRHFCLLGNLLLGETFCRNAETLRKTFRNNASSFALLRKQNVSETFFCFSVIRKPSLREQFEIKCPSCHLWFEFSV